jgi:glyoxylase-like metal-dependent hydrolase (beta-lactamase superfamily II)
MQQSLLRVPLTMPDDTIVRPGHGPDTTIGRERATNPFLLDIASAAGAVAPRRTGI